MLVSARGPDSSRVVTDWVGQELHLFQTLLQVTDIEYVALTHRKGVAPRTPGLIRFAFTGGWRDHLHSGDAADVQAQNKPTFLEILFRQRDAGGGVAEFNQFRIERGGDRA